MKLLPPITKNLLIINALCFVAMFVLSRHHIHLDSILGLHFFLSDNFSPYQLLTYLFMHADLRHILFNMFALWMFGRVIEQVMGSKRFLFYYLACGIGAGATHNHRNHCDRFAPNHHRHCGSCHRQYPSDH